MILLVIQHVFQKLKALEQGFIQSKNDESRRVFGYTAF